MVPISVAVGTERAPRARRMAPQEEWFPAGEAGNHDLVEAGGQHIHGFRRGLDYAFIRLPVTANGCGACYPTYRISGILVLAQAFAIGQSISLYRAGLKLALFLPLGVA